MARNLEIGLKVNDGKAELRSLAEAIRRIGEQGGYSKSLVDSFEQALQHASSSGRSLDTTLKGLASGKTPFQFLAKDTREFWQEQQKAQAEIQKTGRMMEIAYAENARRGQREVQQLGREMANLNRVAGSVMGAGVPGGAAFTSLLGQAGPIAGTIALLATLSAGLLSVANSTGEYARQQENLAAKTGLSVHEAQALSQSAQIAGVNVTSLTTMMRTLSKGFAENSAEGRLAKQAFAELKLDPTVAFEPMDRALKTILVSLSQFPAGAERSRLAISLFGRGGLELLPLVDHIKELDAAIQKNGSIMSDEGVRKAAEYKRQIELLDQAWQGLKRSLGQAAIGVINIVLGGDAAGKGSDYSLGNVATSLGKMLPGIPAPLLDWIKKRAKTGEDWSSSTNSPRLAGDGVTSSKSSKDTSPSPEALAKKQTADEIQGILRSGGGRLQQRERLQQDLIHAEDDLKAAIDGQDKAGVRKYKNQVDGIKTQIKALDEYKSILDEVQKLEQKATLAPFGKVGEIEAQRRDFFQKLKESSLSAGQKTALGAKGEAGFGRELALAAKEEGDKKHLEDAKIQDEFEKVRKERLKTQNESIMYDMHQSVKNTEKDWREERSLRSIDIASQRESVLREASKVDVFAKLKAGPGEEVQTIERSYQTRLGLARQLYELNRQASELEIDDAKRKEDLARGLKDLTAERQVAEIEKEKQLLELTAKRKEEFSNFFAGLVKAGAHGNVTDFIKGTGDTLLGQIAGNFGKSIFKPGMLEIPGQVGKDGQPTFLGTLLGGTMFGRDGGKDANVASTDHNTSATDANTKAQWAVYQALGGNPSAAGGVAVPGGIGGGALKDLSDLLGPAYNLSSGPTSQNGTPMGAPEGTPIPSIFSPDDNRSSSSSGSNGGGFLGGLFGGLSSKGSPLKTLFNGDASAGARLGAGVATAGALFAGVEGVLGGIKQGGARGAVGAVGSALGTAAALDPEPLSKGILAGAAMVSGLIKGFLPDPKAAREREITAELRDASYKDPTPIKLSIDSTGRIADTDFRGRARVVNALPQLESYDKAYGFDPLHPNNVLSSPERRLGTGPLLPPPQIHVHVTTMDSKSFADNAHHIADAMRVAFQQGHPIRNDIVNKLVRPY